MVNLIKIPENWKATTLGQVADYINGRGFKKSEWESSGAPIIRIQNLNNEKATYNYTTREFEDRYKVRKGDLLFAWAASLGAYIWNGEEAWLNQHIFKIEPRPNCLKLFLFYALEKTVAEFYSKTHGSGMVHITKSKFQSTQIGLPPMAEQERIVGKIEELISESNAGVECLRKSRVQLKTYRQAVLKSAFEGGLTNQFVPEGELPPSWTWTTLGELKQFSIYGPRFSSKDYVGSGVAVLRTTDITPSGKVDWASSPKLALSDVEYEKYKLERNDLLLTRTGSIGTVSIFNDDKRAIPGAFLIHYRLENPNAAWYIFYFLQSHAAQRHLKQHSFGVGRPNLNVPNIELLQIPFCRSDERQRVVEEIESRLSVCDKLDEIIAVGLEQSKALRQSILRRAFEGRLVPQEKNDGSASTLFDQVQYERRATEEAQKQDRGIDKGLRSLKRMTEKLKTILEILEENRDATPTRTVWQASIHKDNIDAFYSELKLLFQQKKIKETQREGRESFLTLVTSK